jgi:hypothetical protein
VVGKRGLHGRPGASARRGCPPHPEPGGHKKGVEHPPDEALGRGRGGFSTKVHLACDGKGRPLSVIVTPGQRNDGTQLCAVLDAIRVPRKGREGRASAPSTSWPTGATARGSTGACLGRAVSLTPSPSTQTIASGAPSGWDGLFSSRRISTPSATWRRGA